MQSKSNMHLPVRDRTSRHHNDITTSKHINNPCPLCAPSSPKALTLLLNSQPSSPLIPTLLLPRRHPAHHGHELEVGRQFRQLDGTLSEEISQMLQRRIVPLLRRQFPDLGQMLVVGNLQFHFKRPLMSN